VTKRCNEQTPVRALRSLVVRGSRFAVKQQFSEEQP
jgi:hypothetical protein